MRRVLISCDLARRRYSVAVGDGYEICPPASEVTQCQIIFIRWLHNSGFRQIDNENDKEIIFYRVIYNPCAAHFIHFLSCTCISTHTNIYNSNDKYIHIHTYRYTKHGLKTRTIFGYVSLMNQFYNLSQHYQEYNFRCDHNNKIKVLCSPSYSSSCGDASLALYSTDITKCGAIGLNIGI